MGESSDVAYMPSGDHLPSKEFHLDSEILDGHLRDRRMLFGVEGGALYAGTWSGEACLVSGEGLADYFDNKMGIGDLRPFIRIFRSPEHREAFIVASGGAELRASWRRDRIDDLRGHVTAAYGEGGLDAAERDELLARVRAYRAGGARVGGLEPRHAYLLPDHLEFSLGNSWDKSGTSVRWTGDALLAIRMPHGAHAFESRYEFQPRYEEWRSFWAYVGRLGTWAWVDRDPDDPCILDGGSWDLRLDHRGKDIDTCGTFDGNQPRTSRLERIRHALGLLLDGWPV